MNVGENDMGEVTHQQSMVSHAQERTQGVVAAASPWKIFLWLTIGPLKGQQKNKGLPLAVDRP